jgi:FkbM family methyltransferase
MKRKIRKFLQDIGLYGYLRYSKAFQLYASIFKSSIYKSHQAEILFYQSFLPAHCQLIFDIGANDGHKTAAFICFADKVIACEPDLYNFRLLNIRFRKSAQVKTEQVALADSIGKATLFVHHPGSAVNTLNSRFRAILENDNSTKWPEKITFSSQTQTVTTTTLDNLIQIYGRPDFIKIDTEGYEQWVVKGLSSPVPIITLECLLPEFRDEMISCIDHLEHLSKNNFYNIAVDEKLLFEDYIDKTKLLHWATTATIHHFELVVKMNT